MFDAAAADLAANLGLDTTGMTGSQKVFAITSALAVTSRAGIKADAAILTALALDVA